jgi:predicted HTH transcriptional regulator
MEVDAIKDRPWKENLIYFLKEPTRQSLRQLIQLEAVEDNDLEFKRELLPFDSLAKHVLAMANKNGGAIVFGVDEVEVNQFSPCGLSKSLDLTDIQKKLSIYIPKNLEINIVPHYFKDEPDIEFKNKIFLLVIVYYNPKYIPFLSLKDGEKINRDTIYIRRNRASEPINHDELQDILNNRINTEYSTTNELKLVEHLEELKELYRRIPKTVTELKHNNRFRSSILAEPYDLMEPRILFGDMERKTSPNPEYPQESYDGFIKRIIEIKKDVIVKLVSK